MPSPPLRGGIEESQFEGQFMAQRREGQQWRKVFTQVETGEERAPSLKSDKLIAEEKQNEM